MTEIILATSPTRSSGVEHRLFMSDTHSALIIVHHCGSIDSLLVIILLSHISISLRLFMLCSVSLK